MSEERFLGLHTMGYQGLAGAIIGQAVLDGEDAWLRTPDAEYLMESMDVRPAAFRRKLAEKRRQDKWNSTPDY